jgi:hypothetical protein
MAVNIEDKRPDMGNGTETELVKTGKLQTGPGTDENKKRQKLSGGYLIVIVRYHDDRSRK